MQIKFATIPGKRTEKPLHTISYLRLSVTNSPVWSYSRNGARRLQLITIPLPNVLNDFHAVKQGKEENETLKKIVIGNGHYLKRHKKDLIKYQLQTFG